MSDVVMNCPLCGNCLNRKDDLGPDGRYHCRLCFDGNAEARRGWVPTSRTQSLGVGSAQPTRGLTRVYGDDPMFSHDAKGNVVTRDRTCECGRVFTQRLLSARYLEIVEKWGPGALAAVKRDIPGYFIPVHCPPCERRDLGLASRIAEHRRDYHQEREHAAD